MKKTNIREVKRVYRHQRIRKVVSGTTERPRLCLHRSLKNLSVQIVDDLTGKVLLGMSTLNKDVKKKCQYGGNIAAAAILGEIFAGQAKEQGISKICFDRGGYLYHGRVKAFAEAARNAGLEF